MVKIKSEIFSGESRDIFSETASRLIVEGVRRHEAVHDPAGEDPKEFHRSDHLRRMEARARKLIKAWKLPFAAAQLTTMAIAWHDVVIDYNPVDRSRLLAMISRRRGIGADGNEGKSGRELQKEMLEANEAAKFEVFSREDIALVGLAIDATCPEIDLGTDQTGARFVDYPFFDDIVKNNPAIWVILEELKSAGVEKGPLFFQPILEGPLEAGETISREVLLVALTDLGAAGMDEEKVFFLEGDAEMRELFGNLRRPEVFSRLLNGVETVDSVNREKAAFAFIDWLWRQVGFAAWQYLRFEKIIFLLTKNGQLSPKEEKATRALFGHYEPNLRATLTRAKKVEEEFKKNQQDLGEQEAFKILAKELGY